MRDSFLKRVLQNWGPVLAYAGLIFLLSSIRVSVRPGVDKGLHILEYAAMGFFTTRGVLLSWDLPRLRGALAGAGLATLLGLFDEIHQYFVPGRFASGYDLLADAAGSLLGAALFMLMAAVLYQTNRLYPRAHDDCC